MQNTSKDLGDLLDEEELERLTKEGKAAYGDPTKQERDNAAQLMQEYENRLRAMQMYKFQAFMQKRPLPLFKRYDPGFVRFLLWWNYKEKFDDQPEIKALTDAQWFHGVQNKIIDYEVDEETGLPINVRLIHPYIGKTLNYKSNHYK